MTVLAAASSLVKQYPIGSYRSFPVGAAQKLFGGAMLVLNAATGVAQETSGTIEGHLRVIGVARGQLLKGTNTNVQADNADNTSGAAGDINVLAEVGCFTFVNDATAPLAAADVGADCFAVDDATVSKDSSQGNRACAGVFRGLADDGRAIVEVGTTGSRWYSEVLEIKANADLSTLQNTQVKISNSAGVGRAASATANTDFTVGVLINAPAAAGAVAYIVINGVAPCKVGASNIVAADVCTATAAGATLATVTAGHRYVGQALESGSSGETKMILVNPGSL
jgi:hypothetical protein